MKFFFIFAPNNSGTTIMSQYLQAQCDGYLPPFGNFEGQRIPTVDSMMRLDPWNAASSFDWSFIKREWTAFAKQAGKTSFVEASPPNLIRMDAIVREFASDMDAVISISDPYMQIASSIKNYARKKVTREVIEDFARSWLTKAECQMRNVERYGDRFPLIKYEHFCREPQLFNKIFGLPVEPLADLRGKRNSQVGRIVDMSAKNIAFLTVFEVESVTEILEERTDMLDYFGYRPMDFGGYEQTLRDNPALANAGLVDRIKWETKQVKRGKLTD